MRIIAKHADGSKTVMCKIAGACVWRTTQGFVLTDSDVERLLYSYKRDGATVKKYKRSITIDATNI